MKLKDALLEVFYPAHASCAVCGCVLTDEQESICIKCKKRIVYIEKACLKCGRRLNDENERKLCKLCTDKAYSFTKGVSLFAYESAGLNAVLDFKYSLNPQSAYSWGKELGKTVVKQQWFDKIDVITFVPSSEQSLEKRGYNQALLIAEGINEYTKKAMNGSLLCKRENAKDQIGLSAAERFENALSAYYARDGLALSGENVLLVDDVFTSGATIESCSGAMLAAGAGAVYFAALASTNDKI